MKTCYYCGQPKTSTEHVPPRCIFPDSKDAFGTNLRKNLITVPSCEEHNLGKSQEDEFLMACVTAVVGNNGAAYIQTRTKLYRAIEKSKGRVLRDMITRTKEAHLVMPDGTELPILIGQPDIPRLCRALEHVARGLYFHLKKICFKGECHIIPDFIRFLGNPEIEVIKLLCNSLLLQEESDWISHGENPDIFSFRLGPADEYGLFPMVMTFFRGAKVFVAFQPAGVKLPFHTRGSNLGKPLKIEIQLANAPELNGIIA